ncbi:50S ribosomal protein L18 [archaeon SCG-AAA382B04]|nr:50S ribosomal protein L18 [archaeon SCG-AAA382B04]
MTKNEKLKRRREEKTDYYKRKNLLTSEKPRLVVRKSENHFNVQIIDYKKEGDKILASAHSNNLKEFGWKASTNNTPAAYLTGYLCGLKGKQQNIKSVIPDIGLNPVTIGSNIFAALKGAKDAGIEVPVREKVVPNKERIKGQHIADYADEGDFNKYKERGLDPKDIPDHFEKIKEKITKKFGD